MRGLEIFWKSQNGYYFHAMRFREAGLGVPTHRHNSYRHRLKVTHGRLRLWDEAGGEQILGAGSIRTIPAGVAHELTALEPNTFACCIHRLFGPDGTAYPYDYQLTTREMMTATGGL